MSTSFSWRDRFGQQRIFASAVAPANRNRGIVLMSGPGGIRLHAWDVLTGSTTPVPTPPANLIAHRWLAPTGDYAYLLADEDGNELGHLTAIDLRGTAGPVDLTPSLDPYTLRGVGLSRNRAGLVLDVVDEQGYGIYHLAHQAAPDPAPRLLARYHHEAWNCLLSASNEVATVDVTEQNPGVRRFAVQARRVADGQLLGTLSDGAGTSVEGRLFSPLAGDPTVVVTTDASGVRRPMLWHIADDSRHRLRLHPTLAGDVVPIDWSDDGRHLLLCHTWRAQQQLLRYDLHSDRAEVLAVPSGSYHDDLLRTSQFGPDEQVMVAVETLTRPVTIYRHRPGGETEIALATEALPGYPARSVEITASDGTLAQGWLATPSRPGPHPTIINLHGGPHWAELDAYDPVKAMWLDHGYAYLGLNVRGSTTFGTAYREAIWGNVGHWELEDIVAARRWLVQHQLADPDRMLLMGASYGGYLALYAVSRHPDLWAGAIAEVAIADWSMAYEDVNPAMRVAQRSWFGGTPAERPELYRDRSPITHLAQLAAPVLIRQSRSDTRTPARQMEAYEQRARQLGKSVTVIWDQGGHSLGAGLDFPEQMLAFAAGCCRGD